MAENEIKVIFTGVDNVSAVADEIESRISRGKLSANVPDNLKDSTFGETDQKTIDFLKEMRGQFAEARGEIVLTGEAMWEFEDISASSLAKGGAVAAALAASIGIAAAELDKIVQLSIDRPELFTDQEIENAAEYAAQVKELKDQWLEMKVGIGTWAMPTVTDILETSNNIGRAKELAASAGDNWLFISEKQRRAFIDMAIGEREAVANTEVFDRALLRTQETSVVAADGVKRSAEDIGVSFDAANEPMARTRDLMAEIASYNGAVIKFAVAYETYGQAPGIPQNSTQLPTTPIIEGFGRTQRRSPGGIDMNWVAQEVNRKNTE